MTKTAPPVCPTLRLPSVPTENMTKGKRMTLAVDINMNMELKGTSILERVVVNVNQTFGFLPHCF